jgi:hypothetical protein
MAHRKAPTADEIRIQARHVAADLRIRARAEQSRPDLLTEMRGEGTGWPAMALMRQTYEHDPDATAEIRPADRVVPRGAAGDLLAYLQAQFEPDGRAASPDADLDIDP